MLPSAITTLGIFFLTSIICFGFAQEPNSIFDPSIWEQGITYPPAWLEKCGDGEGDIPLFRDKSEEFKKCFEKQVNVSTFVEELAEAFMESKIPMFAKRHCAKVEAISNCMDQFSHSVEHCFEPGRQEDLRTTAKAIKAALRFVCHRDGERVLIFLRESGIECYHEQSAELHMCVNDTRVEDFTNFTAPGELGFIASLSYDDKLCSHVRKVKDCIFTTMTHCEKRTPSDVVGSLLKTIIKETPCLLPPSGASFNLINFYLVLPTLMVLGYHNGWL